MSRDVNKLHPRLQAKIKELEYLCKEEGLKIGISECLRTVKEQDDLYAKGRTKPGKVVTNAKGSSYSSMHQWAIAFDFYRNDGKGAYNTSGHFFEKVGKLGKKVGLEWGGEWMSIKDLPHFQLPYWGSGSTRIKRKYGTFAKFKKKWTNYKGSYKVKEDCKIRVLPDSNSDKVAKATKGTKVYCNGLWDKSKTGYTWLYVTYKGKEGFIPKSELK